MGNFFGSIYCSWFEDFFGYDLAQFLWGIASPVATTNQFISIGLSMFGISLGMVLLYYYAVNHPAISHWWGWGIFLFVNALINFIVGWQWVLKEYYEGLMYQINQVTGLQEPLNITTSNIVCFGVTNMLLSIIAFVIFSLIFKWWSNNCSNSPF